MDREERKKIRQKIYEIYGWSLKEWAKRRGFLTGMFTTICRGRFKEREVKWQGKFRKLWKRI